MSTTPSDQGGAGDSARRREDVETLIGRLRSTIGRARPMPMSSSVMINRGEVLGLVEALESALPTAFAASDRMTSERDRMVADARDRAEGILAEAGRERDRLVSEAEVLRAGRHEVEELRATAEDECALLRKETDDYVDGRLAALEISLTKTLEAVNRGRNRLRDRSGLGGVDASEDDELFSFPD